MQILCSISGIIYKCDHFPGKITDRREAHPIFSLNTRELLGYSGKWSAGQLTSTDSYLLFLSLLNSTKRVEWRVPVLRHAQTDSIVANNMEALIKICSKIDAIQAPSFSPPSFVCSTDSKTLENVHYWIENWKQSIDDFEDGYRSLTLSQELMRRESALERLIKNPFKDSSSYSISLANWAEIAGDFPKSSMVFNGKTITISDYWKSLIRMAARKDSLISIPPEDLEELIEHCEDYIPHGSIFAFELMSVLRNASKSVGDFFGINLEDGNSNFRVMSPQETLEDAHLKAIIDSAPTEEPRKENYPSPSAFLKAKMAYTLAQRAKKSNK